MELLKLRSLPEPKVSEKVSKEYLLLERLLLELEQKQLPEEVISEINSEVEQANASIPSGKAYSGSRTKILQLLEKKLELVPRHHYRNLWMALGIATFGLPLGLVFSTSLDNFAFMGMGLPIGLALGIAIGTSKDKKAQENGKQLEFENK